MAVVKRPFTSCTPARGTRLAALFLVCCGYLWPWGPASAAPSSTSSPSARHVTQVLHLCVAHRVIEHIEVRGYYLPLPSGALAERRGHPQAPTGALSDVPAPKTSQSRRFARWKAHALYVVGRVPDTVPGASVSQFAHAAGRLLCGQAATPGGFAPAALLVHS